MDVDEIIREVLKVVDQEGTKIDEIVARTLKERTIECDSIIEEYLQKGDVKKAMIVYTKVAGMYNQIADKIQDEKHRKILRMMADFWTRSRDIESELSAELSLPSKKPTKEPPAKPEPKLIGYPIIISPTHREVLPKITEIPTTGIKAESIREIEKVYQKEYIEMKTEEAEVRGYIKEIERMKVQLRGLVEDVTPIHEVEYPSKKRPEETVKELSGHDIDRTYR